MVVPYSAPGKTLIGDNGSLTALFATLRAEIQVLYGYELKFRTLTEYPESIDQIEFVLDDVLSLEPEAQIVFVLSVSGSGRLLDQLTRIAPPGSEIVVIVDTADQPNRQGVRRFASIPLATFPVGANGKCASCEEKPSLGIDARTYERIPNFKFKRVKIDSQVAESNCSFWEATDEARAVHLHFDAQANKDFVRHHAVYIDVPRLLKNSWFRTKAISELQSLTPPDLTIVPSHSAADAVINLIKEVFGTTKIVCVSPGRFSQDVTEAIRSIPHSGSILIADDALVEGTTLLGIRQEYYRVVQQIKAPQIQAFVCVARPESENVLVNTRRPYRDHKGVQLAYAYKVLLSGAVS